METTIIPKWLVVVKCSNYPKTFFGADYARAYFGTNTVYRADKSSGILNYVQVNSVDEIVDDEEEL